MSYDIELSRQAASYYRRLDGQTKSRIRRRLGELQNDPYDSRLTKPLANAAGRRAARVGGWRISYTVDDERRLISVSDIGPRGEIYRGI